MEKVVLFSVYVVRIISIGLLPCSLINEERMIPIEHSPFTILHPKIACISLTQAVDEIAFDLCSDLDVIVTIYDI